VGGVVWRLLVVVGALELVYLLIATVVLRTSLLRDFAARGGDLRVDYDSAYSVLPGRIHVEGLLVRFHDRNVEFSIGVGRGTLDVSLHELAVRRFHALRVDGREVSYRMRHKVSRVGQEGPRLAAYPPIAGFRDPPLYAKGEDSPAPPIPDEEYDLWEVKVDGVHAEVAEVWVLEYRYRGPGLATGSFHVKPARSYEVPYAALDLRGGSLTLGETTVARHAKLAIDCVVAHSDPRKLHGLEPIRNVRAGVRGRLDAMDMGFIDAYLGPRLGARVGGAGRLELDVRVDGGVITQGTQLELSVARALFAMPRGSVAGPAVFELSRSKKAKGADEPFELRFRSERLSVALGGEGVGTLEKVELGAAFTPDLTRPVRMVRASLAPVRADVRDLAALQQALPATPKLPKFSGSAVLRAHGAKDGAGPARGEFRLDLSGATVTLAGARTLPWNATLASEDVEATFGDDASVGGTVALHVDRASALLPLVSSSPIVRDLGERLLELGALDASARVAAGKNARLELTHAHAGIVRARGYVSEQQDGARGRFLVSTPAGNVGLVITPAGTDTELLVRDDWLAARPRGGLPRPGRGELSRTEGVSAARD
jgi:hypothetical protein